MTYLSQLRITYDPDDTATDFLAFGQELTSIPQLSFQRGAEVIAVPYGTPFIRPDQNDVLQLSWAMTSAITNTSPWVVIFSAALAIQSLALKPWLIRMRLPGGLTHRYRIEEGWLVSGQGQPVPPTNAAETRFQLTGVGITPLDPV